MLPSVSEVLKELTARAPVEPDVAFRAAREVCAEELKRIRDAGGDSVPLEELVQRALLRVTGGRPPAIPAPPVPAPAPPPPAPVPFEPAGVFDETPHLPFDPGSPTVDEPFSETTGAMDLRWDPDPREPFEEPRGGLPVSPDASTAVEMPAIPPGPGGSRPKAATDVPVPFALPAEEDVFDVPAPTGEAPAAILLPEPGPEEGPGDETLTRLSREAESIDLQSVFPRPPAAGPAPPELPEGDEAAAQGRKDEEPPPPFEDDEDTVLTIPRGGRRHGRKGRPRLGLLVGVAASLVALAGLGYLLVGLWVERDASPTPVAVARPRPQASPAPLPTPSGPEADTAGPAVPSDAAAPLPVEPPALAPEPVLVQTVPTAVPVAGAAPVLRTRDGLVVTKDREGQPQVFSIHFTSYRDRAAAERDLRRIEGLVGREGYVAEVDLGEKGVWQRVMIGAFPTAQEARAVREELVAKGTRDMGWVYRVLGAEGSAPR
jgi:hypothetical protein